MIECHGLKKTFYTKDTKVEVLRDINLTVEDGEFVCLYGASGSGKSTLLNLLGLLDTKTEGEYLVDGVNSDKLSEKQKAIIRNEKMGFVFQSYNLVPELNAFENIEMPMGYGGVPTSQRRQRTEELLEEFSLGHIAKKYASQLSGGEQQRIAIARAIVNRPQILFADEPTGNLDQENGLKVMEIFKSLNEKGMTIIMVTHDPTLAAYGSRIIHLVDGRIVE